MTISLTQPHVAQAARGGNIAGLFQARCSCGWRSAPQDERTANEDAEMHVAAALVVERHNRFNA